MEAGVVSAEPSQPFPPCVDARVWVGGDTWTQSHLWGALRSGEVPCRNVSTHMFVHRESGRNPMGALQQATENNTWFSFPTMLKVKHQKEHHFLVSHWNGWSAFSFYWDNSLSLPKVKNVLHSLTVCRLGVELLYQNIYSATEHHNHFKMLYSSVQRRPAVLISNSIFLSGMVQVAIQNNLYMSCADTLFLSWLSSNSFLL